MEEQRAVRLSDASRKRREGRRGNARMGYAYLADALAAVHLAFVCFVLFGQAFILAGWALRWGAVRNFWFRALHLLAIAVVAAEALLHIDCPLTVWEYDLRVRAGQDV